LNATIPCLIYFPTAANRALNTQKDFSSPPSDLTEFSPHRRIRQSRSLIAHAISPVDAQACRGRFVRAKTQGIARKSETCGPLFFVQFIRAMNP
jgi:hypothetical protein